MPDAPQQTTEGQQELAKSRAQGFRAAEKRARDRAALALAEAEQWRQQAEQQEASASGK